MKQFLIRATRLISYIVIPISAGALSLMIFLDLAQGGNKDAGTFIPVSNLVIVSFLIIIPAAIILFLHPPTARPRAKQTIHDLLIIFGLLLLPVILWGLWILFFGSLMGGLASH